jgi:hypothetical protein
MVIPTLIPLAVALVAVSLVAHHPVEKSVDPVDCFWEPSDGAEIEVGNSMGFGAESLGCTGYTGEISPPNGGAGFNPSCSTTTTNGGPLFKVFGCTTGDAYTLTIKQGSTVIQTIPFSVIPAE